MNFYSVEILVRDIVLYFYGKFVFSDEGVFNRDRERERKNCCVVIGNYFCKGCINYFFNLL